MSTEFGLLFLRRFIGLFNLRVRIFRPACVSRQVIMHGARSLFTGADGQDDGGGAGYDIAAGKNAGFSGAPFFVGNEITAFIGVDTGGGRGDDRVGRLADGNHCHVDLDDKFRTLDGNRSSPSPRRPVRQAPCEYIRLPLPS